MKHEGLPNVITLEVLLHYYYCPYGWSTMERRVSIASAESHRWLLRAGMIEIDEVDDTKITPRGRFYVNALLEVPLPVSTQIWEIPRP